ncbi:MAG: 4-hydroxybenzoate octaprenyltransferase, partial [Marinicaulis sp.]|nr:4-hydroxybenzoate octaprenyltransferase [Marinicaulis sp.]
MTAHSSATADTAPGNWVERMPPRAQPYLRLIRADRPIGTWLLLIPCWWGLGLAAVAGFTGLKLFYYGALFAIGAFVMRGAGCAYNDIVDRDIDGQVERTALRPIPSGQISIKQASIFLGVLCFIGLIVLLQFNRTTIFLGLGSLALVAAYPFMKRVTYWPQAWLGLTFNWGALMGFTAASGRLSFGAVAIYAAGIFWTLGYDTIYAHQDKEDDALIGVKST